MFAYTNIKTVLIPDSVTFIGAGAFSLCSELEKIEGMNKVEFVGSRAFADCPKLTDINVPSSAEVDISAFDGSENVKK